MWTRFIQWGMIAVVVIASGFAVRQWMPTPETEATVPLPPDLERANVELRDLINDQHQVVKENPKDASAWLKLGIIYQANMIIDLSGTCFEQALQLDSESARIWYHVAYTRAADAEVESATTALREAARRLPDYPPVHWRLGQILLEQNRLDEAQQAFQKTLRINQQEPAAWFGIAKIHMQRGEEAEAAGVIEQVMQWLPVNRHYGYQLLTVLYSRLGLPDAAEYARVRSYGGDVHWPDPWHDEVFAYKRAAGWELEVTNMMLQGGQVDQAIGMLEKYRLDDPDNVVLLANLAAGYRTKNRYEKSLEVLNHALVDNPDAPNVHFNLGLTYLAMADDDSRLDSERESLIAKARSHCDYMLERSPTHPSIQGLQAQLFEREGKGEEALESYRIAANDEANGGYWLYQAGRLHAARDEWDDAMMKFELATIRSPDMIDAVHDMADAQIKAGKLNEAFYTIQRFSFMNPNDPRGPELDRALQEARAKSGRGNPSGTFGQNPSRGRP